MAKLPIVLKQGILNGDWTAICRVYTAITGEKIEPPKSKSEAEELSNMDIPEIVGVTPMQSPPTEEDNEEADEDFSILPQRKIKLGKRQRNKFVDDFTLNTKDLKSSNPTLDKMYKQTPSQRRSPAQLIELQCTQCKKMVKVSPILAVGRTTNSNSKKDQRALFRCDDCSKRG